VKVTVNGGPKDLPAGTSVADLVRALGRDPSGRGLAVARNGEVVPRSDWESTKVSAEDRFEVLAATQGG
jgi:sulfur carrier protein